MSNSSTLLTNLGRLSDIKLLPFGFAVRVWHRVVQTGYGNDYISQFLLPGPHLLNLEQGCGEGPGHIRFVKTLSQD